jgi:hypothetical protein
MQRPVFAPLDQAKRSFNRMLKRLPGRSDRSSFPTLQFAKRAAIACSCQR